jgi:hypothetical protein
MDQKEIDALISKSQGSIAEFNKKQEELIKHLAEKNEPASLSRTESSPKKGKVMGQLSRVTEEAEAGTNMVMGYLENILAVVSRQQDFVKDITGKYRENPDTIDVLEALTFLADNFSLIEELIYSAMDAFQFQDIGRQKLMKVMYTLSKLNEYLNELLGGHEERGRQWGSTIEKKSMEQDKEKDVVDQVVSDFKSSSTTGATAANPVSDAPAQGNPVGNSESVDNSDIDSIIAEFQQKNKNP